MPIQILLLVLLYLMTASAKATPVLFQADFRHRPPEMTVADHQVKGPLIDILDMAAERIGAEVQWRQAPFPRSLQELRTGQVDLVPRTIHTADREKNIAFLGPIGAQQKDILFLVAKGQADRIRRYEDLQGLRIGVKRATSYFARFNDDNSLNKLESLDDRNMSRMFASGRFDTMVILDRTAIEAALRDIGVTEYDYAHYRYRQTLGNYYGMSRKSPLFHLYPQLNQALLDMVQTGEVDAIYKKYGLAPPLHFY